MLKVDYRLQVSKEQLAVGEPFELSLWVRDLRPWGSYYNPYFGEERNLVRGVFAAYTSILFDKSYAKVMTSPTAVSPASLALSYRNQFRFSQPYTNGKLIVDGQEGIARVGAFSSDFDGVDQDEDLLVCTIKLITLKQGTVVFQTSNKYLKYPMDATLVYGNDVVGTPIESSVVTNSEITWQRTIVQVG